MNGSGGSFLPGELDDELVALLDEPLHHAGGRQVHGAIVEHVLPLLSADERALAPVNLRWHKGRISGVPDRDFARDGDPALDAAAFAGCGWPPVRRVRPDSYERSHTDAPCSR